MAFEFWKPPFKNEQELFWLAKLVGKILEKITSQQPTNTYQIPVFVIAKLGQIKLQICTYKKMVVNLNRPSWVNKNICATYWNKSLVISLTYS